MATTLNFPGNPRIRTQLERALEAEQVTGSYLFEGASGAGQEGAAVELAARLITGSSDPAHPEAGRVLRYSHPDLIYVMPITPSKTPAAMGDEDWLADFREMQGRRGRDPLATITFKANPRISVKGQRAIRGELSKMPYEGRARVLIVRDADRMDIDAQDALLKTLEEPPRGTVVILISYRPDALSDTILSRCRRLPFDPLEDAVLVDALVSRGLGRERAEFFAGLSGGDLEAAVRLESSESEEGNALLQRREEWLDFIDLCEFGDEVAMIEAVQEFSRKYGKQPGEKLLPTQLRAEFMSLALSWYRDLLGLAAFGGLRVHRDQDSRRARYAELTPEQLVDRIQRFEKARSQILRFANIQLTLLSLYLGLRAAGART